MIVRDTMSSRQAFQGQAEFRAIAQHLRDQWKAWQGEDSLHEMAFGERVE